MTGWDQGMSIQNKNVLREVFLSESDTTRSVSQMVRQGNGRTARAMMNAELVAAGVCRIMIPSVYRNEYISSLKLLSDHKEPSSFLRVMSEAQDFVSRIDFSELAAARRVLEVCNAFERPADNVKLMMPSCR
jgi:hypothetical protein